MLNLNLKSSSPHKAQQEVIERKNEAYRQKVDLFLGEASSSESAQLSTEKLQKIYPEVILQALFQADINTLNSITADEVLQQHNISLWQALGCRTGVEFKHLNAEHYPNIDANALASVKDWIKTTYSRLNVNSQQINDSGILLISTFYGVVDVVEDIINKQTEGTNLNVIGPRNLNAINLANLQTDEGLAIANKLLKAGAKYQDSFLSSVMFAGSAIGYDKVFEFMKDNIFNDASCKYAAGKILSYAPNIAEQLSTKTDKNEQILEWIVDQFKKGISCMNHQEISNISENLESRLEIAEDEEKESEKTQHNYFNTLKSFYKDLQETLIVQALPNTEQIAYYYSGAPSINLSTIASVIEDYSRNLTSYTGNRASTSTPGKITNPVPQKG